MSESTPTTICRWFLSGNCKYGSSCKFLHSKHKKLCKLFLSGSCKQGSSCEFLHTTHEKSGHCRQFLLGNCKHGSSCKFIHDKKRQEEQCRTFSRDHECSYGGKCRFIHDKSLIRKIPKLCQTFSTRKVCEYTKCLYLHHDIKFLESKSKWKYYDKTVFKIHTYHSYSPYNPETANTFLAIWTLDGLSFYRDSRLEKQISDIDDVCKEHPPVRDGLKKLIALFGERDTYLQFAYDRLLELSLPTVIVDIIINDFLAYTIPHVITAIGYCGN